MWDPIVSVPDHCLSFYFAVVSRVYYQSIGVVADFSKSHGRSIKMETKEDVRCS